MFTEVGGPVKRKGGNCPIADVTWWFSDSQSLHGPCPDGQFRTVQVRKELPRFRLTDDRPCGIVQYT
jgi:hypothetical protein